MAHQVMENDLEPPALTSQRCHNVEHILEARDANEVSVKPYSNPEHAHRSGFGKHWKRCGRRDVHVAPSGPLKGTLLVTD